MGLQLRLSHPLGEQLIDLEARPADRPVVVGRASDCELQVPSPNVSKAHCHLFVRDGQWVLRDAGSTGGTFLNGKPVRDAVGVKSGDVVTLGAGAKPPTLTIDPHRVGVAEAPDGAAEAHAGPAGSQGPTAAPAAGFRMPPPSAAPVRPGVMPPPPRAAPMVPQGPPRGYAAAGAAAPAAAPAAVERTGWEDTRKDDHFYVPKRKKSSSGALVAAIVVSAGVAVGGFFGIRYAYQRYQEASKPKVIVITRTVAPAATTATAPTSIFDAGQQLAPTTGPMTASADAPPRAARTAAPMPPPAAEPAPDKRREDPEWQAVEQARYDEPVRAIVKINDYRERFPDTPFKADLDQYVDDAVDRLWWKRVVDLFVERDAALKEITDLTAQIKQSAEGEFRRGLEADLARWTQVRDRADESLRTQMKFTRPAPPNVYDSQELAGVRTGRDAAAYAAWKEQVLTSIRRSRGEKLPWKQSR